MAPLLPEKVKLLVSNVTLTDAASTLVSTVTKLRNKLRRVRHDGQRAGVRHAHFVLSLRPKARQVLIGHTDKRWVAFAMKPKHCPV